MQNLTRQTSVLTLSGAPKKSSDPAIVKYLFRLSLRLEDGGLGGGVLVTLANEPHGSQQRLLPGALQSKLINMIQK